MLKVTCNYTCTVQRKRKTSGGTRSRIFGLVQALNYLMADDKELISILNHDKISFLHEFSLILRIGYGVVVLAQFVCKASYVVTDYGSLCHYIANEL
jgi:hypothetical protein